MIKFILQIISMFNLVTLIVRVFRWILPTKEEIPMGINKEEMLVVLKDLAEWNDFLVAIEKTVIEVLTDDKKQIWYLELMEILVKLVNDAIPALSTAIEDSGKIPEQWTASSTSDKVMFFVNLSIAHAMTIVKAIFDKPAVETPAA